MKHYTYKIINNINGHYYYGRRSYEGDLLEEDTYFGSGKRLKLAFRKYGIENFTKKIVEEFETYDELVIAEKNLITSVEVNDDSCYNLALGGHGGYTYYADRKFKHTDEAKQKISIANTGRPRPDAAERNKNGEFSLFWLGKTRSSDDRQKKSDAAKNNIINGTHAGSIILTCPHCNKKANTGNAKRWHFDKCRNK